MTNKKIILVAGEASGDMHAANLVKYLHQLRPELEISAMGGDALKKQNVEILVDNRELAVVGLIEVIKHYPDIRRALKTMQQLLKEKNPDLLILVDYVEFNLKLAETAKKLGIKVLFYISPQVWAWRPKRVKRIGKLVDMMAVIFPFETKFYERHHIPVRYVGNPLVGHVKAKRSLEECYRDYEINPEHPVIGLLPGSRRSEIKNLFALFMQTAKTLQAKIPDAQFLLPLAPGLSESDLTHLIQNKPDNLKIITDGKTYDVMQSCDVILTASGTATLETALMGVPMTLAYRTSPVTYAIFRRMLKIPYIGLVNIVAGKKVVQEFIQHEATEDILSNELIRLLTDKNYREKIITELDKVKEKLGSENGSKNVAKLALELLS